MAVAVTGWRRVSMLRDRHHQGPRLRAHVSGAIALGVIFATLVLIAGCHDADFGVVAIEEFEVPGEPDLATPESAVYSYLDWVSFAYRMANSQLPVDTMTGMQYVRVDAYIELNRQEGAALDQELLDLSIRTTSEEETATIIAASERWRFRYFSLDTLRYTTPPREVRYETTYTVVREGDVWLVDSVDADPLDPLD